jgi:hypothetical protein
MSGQTAITLALVFAVLFAIFYFVDRAGINRPWSSIIKALAGIAAILVLLKLILGLLGYHFP